MNAFMIRPMDVYDIMKKRSKILAISFAVTFLFIFSLAFILPKTYKAQATIHIGVNYFQNPLIQDMVASTFDPNELRAQREGLLRKGLGFEFGQKAGEQYKVFSTEPDSKMRPIEVGYLLKNIDISPVTSTQYKVLFKAGSPEAAYGIVNAAIQAITETMYNDRLQTIRELRDAINTQLGRDTPEDSGSEPKKVTRSQPQVTTLAKQLDGFEQELRRLRRTYSDAHPKIVTLNKKISDLKGFMAGEPGDVSKMQMLSSSDPVAGEAALDLERKSHLLGISLEIESKDPSMKSYLSVIESPVMPVVHDFPKAKSFILFGLVAAIMVSTLITAMIELYSRLELRPKHLAEQMKVPVLDAVVYRPSKT